jgi:hypothetical protein
MYAFLCLRGVKILLGEDLDLLGMLVDIAKMEKGSKASDAADYTPEHFIGGWISDRRA